jgi:hypothetical protein
MVPSPRRLPHSISRSRLGIGTPPSRYGRLDLCCEPVGISSIVSRLTPFGYSFNYIQGLVDGPSLRDIADWLLEREALMSEARTLELEEIKRDPTDVHVFVSYSHEDFGVAQCLQEELTAVNPARVHCFLDAYKPQGRRLADLPLYGT